jgi:FKBP-type peptidyl-prolyl cis-trans isomerase
MKRGCGGVQYEDIKLGDGRIADRGAIVDIRYSLFLNRGELVQKDEECSFRVGERNVIPGLEYGVEGMHVGGERRIRVGPHLAYRDHEIPALVPPNAVLEFHVTLLRVRSPQQCPIYPNQSNPKTDGELPGANADS